MQRDFVALQWVTSEIEQTSRQLGAELLGFADNLSDPTRLRHALTLAHQIRATLRMLDIPSAEQLAREAELTVQAMLHGQIPPSEDTLQALLAAGMQLPAYLRRVAQERRELPADILDVTNMLRATRGEPALPPPEQSLPSEFPELSDACGDASADASDDDIQFLRKARLRFQSELLGLLRKEGTSERLHALSRVFGSLAQRLRPGGQRLMWQACAAACDAALQGGVEAGEPLMACMRQIDEEFRQLANLEQRFFSRTPSEPLYRALLSIIADSLPATPVLIECQQRYRLLPSRTAADGTVLEDLGATATVIGVLSSELSGVLGRLEGTEGDALSVGQALREVEPDLRRMDQVLRGLGYTAEADILGPQVARIASGIPGGDGLDDRLTDITTSLLELDQRLAERVIEAGGNTGDAVARRHPLERAREAVCREVQLGLEQSKQIVCDYANAAGDVRLLEALPQHLNVLVGALRMAELGAAAGILASGRDYVRGVLDGSRTPPGPAEIDALADALSRVEYFIERLVIDGKPADLILVRAQAALRRVIRDVPPVISGRAPVRGPTVPSVNAAVVDQVSSTVAPAELPAIHVEIEAEPASDAAPDGEIRLEPLQESENAPPVEPSHEAEPESAPEAEPEPEPAHAIEGEELDPEILEIFVEEATEVLQTIAAQLPLWRAVPTPGPALTELRRAFHTLKGSGRMVGAAVIGELAWSIENLLNRVLERSVEATPAVLDIVDRTQALMPSLVQAFAERRSPDAAAAAVLRERALAIARGELPADAAEPEPVLETPAEPPRVEADAPLVETEPELLEELEELAWEPVLEPEEEALAEELPVDALPEPAEELTEQARAEREEEIEPTAETSDVLADEFLLPEAEFLGEELPVEAAEEPVDALVAETALEDWLPEPETDMPAEAEPSIEDWLPELEPTEIAAAERVDPPPEPETVEVGETAFGVRDIFAEEAREHLDALVACLLTDPTTADDRLLRSIHTLRGGAHVAELASLGELLDPLDAAARAANAVPRPLRAAERELLTRLCPLLEDYIACGMFPDEDLVARTESLREEALALADMAEATASVPDAQAEARLARFLEEALERLFHARSLLDAWRAAEEPGPNREALSRELRNIHQRAEQLEVGGVLALSGGLLAASERIEEAEAEDLALLESGIEAFLDALDRLAANQQTQIDAALLEALASLAARPRERVLAADTGPAPVTSEPEHLRSRITRELQQADPELLDIFLEEAAELLASIDEGIDDWRHDRNNRAPYERLQRDLHTLKGGARMAGLRHVGELSHNIETFIINHGVQFGSFDDAFFQRVLGFHEQLLQVMDLVRGGPGAVVPEADTAAEAEAVTEPETAPEAVLEPAIDVVAEPEPEPEVEAEPEPEPEVEAEPAAETLAEPETMADLAAEPAPDAVAEPETAPEFVAEGQAEPEIAPAAALTMRERIARDLANADAELLGIFLEEAEELMASVDGGIDAWRAERGNRALFDKLQRDLHTLKGGARMAGISVLGDLAHDFESMLIAEGANPAALPDAFFLRVADFHEQLARAMDVVRERPVPGAPEPVSKRATPETDSVQPKATEPVAEEAPAITETAPAMPPAALPELPSVTLPLKVPQPVPAAVAAKPRDEVVRVSSQLLEDLVNLAGETSISRGRVEEQVSELSQLFEDMQSTIERLQSQVRRLDIATEAQILFRRERAESVGTEGFDPLEMDRYSQLQQLSRSLVESGSDILDIKRTLSEKTRDLETVLIQQSRINSQLQEGLMRSRMVPFASILPRIRRVVRQVATELDKNVELELGKMEGELDRGILERIVAPLEHMLRNAVDHGIESRERRVAAGKPETGHIRIDIAREGGDVLLALSDDGAGVNIDAVRRKAIERGLMTQEAALGDHEITQFILHSGFSTAEKVTQISGRGVGMDVVSSEIRQMGGSLEIHSTRGQGSRFVIRLPFTVSVSRSLMVNVGTDTYALPLNTVEGVVRMPARDMARYTGPDAELLSYAGQQYAVRHLGELLYPGEQVDVGNLEDNVPVVLVRAGGQALAVEVDRLVGAREIVVKGLGPQFGAVPGLSGATVLGDGSVVLILDIPAMLRADSARGTQRNAELARPETAAPTERPPLVMVVDDSVTVRKVTTRFLEREGMRVITAKDGAEAMVMLQEQVPDLMLLDIEMPHMDGFEVLSKLRLSDALRSLPVIMITSRTGDKHRERALSLGANMYLGKPYQESVLLEHIGTLLARTRQQAKG